VLIHALSCAYDWVLWVDADAFNTNLGVGIMKHIVPEAAAQHQRNLLSGYLEPDFDLRASFPVALKRALLDWQSRMQRAETLVTR